jgi:hypothetical protein
LHLVGLAQHRTVLEQASCIFITIGSVHRFQVGDSKLLPALVCDRLPLLVGCSGSNWLAVSVVIAPGCLLQRGV